MTYLEPRDYCLIQTIPHGGEDYWQYYARVREAELFELMDLSVAAQNTWIYHPDSPHNRVYEEAA